MVARSTASLDFEGFGSERRWGRQIAQEAGGSRKERGKLRQNNQSARQAEEDARGPKERI